MSLMTIASQNNICWILFLMFLSLFNRKNNIWRILVNLFVKHQLHLLSVLCLKYNGTFLTGRSSSWLSWPESGAYICRLCSVEYSSLLFHNRTIINSMLLKQFDAFDIFYHKLIINVKKLCEGYAETLYIISEVINAHRSYFPIPGRVVE